MPEIEIKNVTKHYGPVRALHQASLKVKNGEYVVLLGPSGCGKTTLLKTIAGIIPPSSGSIFIDRQEVTNLAPEERHLGFVFQNYALFPHMTVLDNALYGLLARGSLREDVAEKVVEVLKLVHLETRLDAIPRELSGGMQQRLAVGRALSTGAKLLLLDEPTNALDAHLRIELRNELRKMAKRLHLTVIHVTHDQEEAMAIADKIVIMRSGQILQVDSPTEVYDHPVSPFVANFIGEANFIRVSFKKGKAKLLGQEVKNGGHSGEYLAVIRPESFWFSKDKGAKISMISKQKLGPFFKYEVDCDGLKLSVRTHSEWNYPTHLMFNQERTLFFAEPEEGLERSLLIE